jgi:cytoplasmic iron level regulating protein YaaA (DUF328/UPF0246 family)
MRILLPPSEAKTSGGRGRKLAGRTAADDALSTGRATTLAALQALLEQGREPAATALLLPPAVVDEALAINAAVLGAATTPALQRYSGVVYAGLAAAQMSAVELRLAQRNVLIFSGLFGVVRGNEPIPSYRVPAKATLPGIGVAGTFWRPILEEVLPPLLGRHLVIDLRSSDYQAMWRPRGNAANRVLNIRVLSPRAGAPAAVISYPSKFGKGRLARALIEAEAGGQRITRAGDVADVWLRSGGSDVVERPNALDLLL